MVQVRVIVHHCECGKGLTVQPIAPLAGQSEDSAVY